MKQTLMDFADAWTVADITHLGRSLTRGTLFTLGTEGNKIRFRMIRGMCTRKDQVVIANRTQSIVIQGLSPSDTQSS